MTDFQTINIREGNSNDIHNICKLLISVWKNSYSSFIPVEFLNKLDLNSQIERHKKYMGGSAKYFIAENSSNEFLGFSSYGKNRIKNINCSWELYTLYVGNNFHRKGIGKMLIDAVFADFNNKNSSICVSVFEMNPYRVFYKKHGF